MSWNYIIIGAGSAGCALTYEHPYSPLQCQAGGFRAIDDLEQCSADGAD